MRRKPMDPELRRACFERARWICERCWLRPCVEAHHKLYRSRGGRDELENLAALCKPCHDYVHSHATESEEEGWVTASGRPSKIVPRQGAVTEDPHPPRSRSVPSGPERA